MTGQQITRTAAHNNVAVIPHTKAVTILDLGTDTIQAELGARFGEWLQARDITVSLMSLRSNARCVGMRQYRHEWESVADTDALLLNFVDHLVNEAHAQAESVSWLLTDCANPEKYLMCFAWLVDTVVVPVASDGDYQRALQLFARNPTPDFILAPVAGWIGPATGLTLPATQPIVRTSGSAWDTWCADLAQRPGQWWPENAHN